MQLWEEVDPDDDADDPAAAAEPAAAAAAAAPGAAASSAIASAAPARRHHFEYPQEGDEVVVRSSAAAAAGGRSGPATVLGPATDRPWITGRVAARVLWDGTAEVSVVDLPEGPAAGDDGAAERPARTAEREAAPGGGAQPPPLPSAAESEVSCCVQ